MSSAAALYVNPGPVVQRCTAFNAVARFWALDPQTGDGTLTDPDEVTFTVLAPDDTSQSYSTGDPEVTNLDVGVWSLALDSELPTGVYHVGAVGEGDDFQAQAPSEAFTVVDSPVAAAPEPPPRPVQGPCTPWISGQDLADCARLDYDSAPFVFDEAAFNASSALYEVSDRRFPGICQRKVRPCRTDCTCWLSGPISYGMGPWYWTTVPFGFGGWAWYNESGDKFGCAPMSKVRLAGGVVEVVAVTIDGADVPEFDPDSGFRNWRLDKWRYLVRMDDPAAGTPAQPRFWPSCQNMSLDDDQPGTFSVSYKWGADVPQLGRAAAVELAGQLYLACGGDDCALPVGVTQVVRQGITIERGLLADWLNSDKPTGLVNLDLFLNAYGRGKRAGRRSAIWSPDLQQFARRVGVNET